MWNHTNMQKFDLYWYLGFVLLACTLFDHFVFAQNKEKIPLFIDDFTFEGFSKNKEEIDHLGKILSAELQSQLQQNELITPYTLTNLNDQLKKEKEKVLLGCNTENCTRQIIENFGISDRIQGMIRLVSSGKNKKTYQMYLSYFFTKRHVKKE